MDFWTRARRWLKQFAPQWRPTGGSSFFGFYDAYRSKPAPSTVDLIRAFDDVVYSCVSLISSTIASTPFRLYVETGPGMSKPKCATRPVSRKTLDRLSANPTTARRISKSYQIHEVIEHPALDLLYHVNKCHNQVDLLELTSLFLEITGNAYWCLRKDDFNIPRELYLIPSQFVTVQADEHGFPAQYQVGNGQEKRVYPRAEILHFMCPSLETPYLSGMSPLRAAWQRVMISWKELAYLDSVLTNNAMPSAILTPNEPISQFESERLAREFMAKFKGAGNGGIMVADGPMTLQPLSFPPRQIAELDLYQVVKTSVCNAFGVPIDIFQPGQANRSSAEAAQYNLAVFCIKPRITRLLEKLNTELLPLFDPRLFLEAEAVVPEDKAFELQKRQAMLAGGVITRDE